MSMISHKEKTMSCYTTTSIKNWVTKEARRNKTSVSQFLFGLIEDRMNVTKPTKKCKTNKTTKTKTVIKRTKVARVAKSTKNKK